MAWKALFSVFSYEHEMASKTWVEIESTSMAQHANEPLLLHNYQGQKIEIRYHT